MAITLARVDDRVIHGQTTTRWSKERPIDGFLVVGDKIIHDKLRTKVLKAAAGNLKVGIFSDDKGPEIIKKGVQSHEDFVLISNSAQTFDRLLQSGADWGNELNVGPMNTREGAIVVERTLALDDKDYEAFDYMYNHGINISFQLIPDEKKKTWPEVRKHYDELKAKEG